MSNENPKKENDEKEMIDDLMIRPADDERRERSVSSSVKEIASRIPDSLSAIGREISHTIERAISAKDDYVVAVKLSEDAQEKLEQLVQAGLYRSRAEAAAFLIDEGIKSQAVMFERVQQKLTEIERLRAEIRGIIQENK
jgi:Arc/MetJ-type ribon-helix-helix transcriptional regulator